MKFNGIPYRTGMVERAQELELELQLASEASDNLKPESCRRPPRPPDG